MKLDRIHTAEAWSGWHNWDPHGASWDYGWKCSILLMHAATAEERVVRKAVKQQLKCQVLWGSLEPSL